MNDDMATMITRLIESELKIIEKFKGLTEQQLELPASWANSQRTVRFLAQRFAGHDDNHLNQIRKNRQVVSQPTEAHLLLAQALAARAELIGSIIGMTPEEFDRPPREGEWSTRQVLQHCLDVDDMYTNSIENGLKTAV